MEIITRKHHGDTGELVPFNVKSEDLQDEVNSRTHKAGHTNRQGERLWSNKIWSGKTDRYRSVDKKKYDENYERIFGHK